MASLDLRAHKEAAAATDVAEGHLTAAREAVRDAERVVATVAAEIARAEGNPLALAQAEREAADCLARANRTLVIAESACKVARNKQQECWGEAHRPLHDEGVAIRLAAARRADAARVELAAAESDFARGSALIHQARAKGCAATAHLDGALLNGRVGTERDELQLWGLTR